MLKKVISRDECLLLPLRVQDQVADHKNRCLSSRWKGLCLRHRTLSFPLLLAPSLAFGFISLIILQCCHVDPVFDSETGNPCRKED